MASGFSLTCDRRAVIKRISMAAGAVGLTQAHVFKAFGQAMPINCSPVNPPETSTPFQPNSALPMRVRKSVFDLTQDEVVRLKEAYAALRKLSQDDPLDPRGWINQAHVHCWYCGGPSGNGQNAGAEIHGT
jgi:hypothetical protein